ncbi:urease accessory protein UreF [Devosia albogilva]|uniref:Urease accessory protein UreF n=1 Tax=Devosia albogilva TaxID=429726 RepID=A0ABW5QGQ7_9HYPH
MTRPRDLQLLLTWLSPAFPVGAFAWSAGLETAIATGTVKDRATAEDWISGILHHGGLRTDTILLSGAWRASADPTTLQDLADLCLALTPARERHEETLITGDAFVAALRAWPEAASISLPQPCPYPIAVGAAAARIGIDLQATLLAWLTAAVHAQVSVCVRLVPIGQTDGLTIMAALEPTIAILAAAAATATTDDIGGVAYAADIAQMSHETLTTRIFRS